MTKDRTARIPSDSELADAGFPRRGEADPFQVPAYTCGHIPEGVCDGCLKERLDGSGNRYPVRGSVVIRYNDRNYTPGEWEAWRGSQVVAHARNLDLVTRKYPNATVVYSDGIAVSPKR